MPRLRINSCALLSIAAAAVAIGAPVVCHATDGSHYVALRRAERCDKSVTYAAVSENPSGFAGRVIELKGAVNGTVVSSDGISIMLEMADRSTVDLTPPRAEEPLVRDNDGPRIRALVRVLGNSAGNVPTLKVLAIAHESEVAAIEQAAAARHSRRTYQAARVSYSSSRPSLPSRGDYSRASGSVTELQRLTRRYDPYLTERARPLFPAYLKFIYAYNRRLTGEQAAEITTSLLVFADRQDVDPRLIVAMIIAESGFDPSATSKVGAAGLGQLMPGTARELGVSNPYDPVENLNGSVAYLRDQLNTFADHALPGGGMSVEQAALAMAAYNAGTNAVRKYGGIPPYRETQAYVRRVISIYQQLISADPK